MAALEGLVLYVPLLAWIGVIVYLSSGKNSISRTLPVFVRVFGPLVKNTNTRTLGKYHVIVRKVCHVVGYALLALLACTAFRNSRVLLIAQYWHVWALALTFLVAAADETRQYFDPDRVGSVLDVALDCAGGAIAILLFWILST